MGRRFTRPSPTVDKFPTAIVLREAYFPLTLNLSPRYGGIGFG